MAEEDSEITVKEDKPLGTKGRLPPSIQSPAFINRRAYGRGYGGGAVIGESKREEGKGLISY